MSSSLHKRVKEVSNIDRLSELPDSIITRILCFLKVDESAVTAVLSRRWRFLWIQSPEFSFTQGNLSVPDFVARVNRTLVARGPDHVESFLVDFWYENSFSSDVNAWVLFAVINKVKKVSFLLNNFRDFYVLPQLMCSNSSLGYLSIKRCTFAPQGTIDWPSLTYLHIKEVQVEQHLIEKILSGSPVLSSLTLNSCWGFNSLDIKSKALNKIRIWDRDDAHIHGSMLEISAPYLKSLSVYLSYPERRKLRLTNIPSLVTATFEFIGFDFQSVEVMNHAKELLGKIQHVKETRVGGSFVEVLSWLAINHGYQFPQSTLRKSLTIKTDRDELGNIHGILGLLKSSPNLEKLVIEGEYFCREPYNCTCANGDQVSDLLQLKTIIIKNFVAPNLAGEPMLTLVRILLKRTPVLEKIVIYVKEIAKSSSAALDPFTILEKLFGYPRSSQNASILLR